MGSWCALIVNTTRRSCCCLYINSGLNWKILKRRGGIQRKEYCLYGSLSPAAHPQSHHSFNEDRQIESVGKKVEEEEKQMISPPFLLNFPSSLSLVSHLSRKKERNERKKIQEAADEIKKKWHRMAARRAGVGAAEEKKWNGILEG